MSRALYGTSRAGQAFALDSAAPVDLKFRNNREGTHDYANRRSCCTACGGRHSPTMACREEALASDSRRNGRYSGPCAVRTIPPGVTGADLVEQRRQGTRVVPRAGQHWQGPAGALWRIATIRAGMVTMRRVGTDAQCKLTLRSLRTKRAWRLLAEAS